MYLIAQKPSSEASFADCTVNHNSAGLVSLPVAYDVVLGHAPDCLLQVEEGEVCMPSLMLCFHSMVATLPPTLRVAPVCSSLLLKM